MTLRCYQYDLPFVKPMKTSGATYRSRKGLILEYRDQRGCFYGEAAPLEVFSGASLAEVIREFKRQREPFAQALNARQPTSALKTIASETILPAPLLFGLDTLAHRIEACESEIKLPEFLFSKKYCSKIPVNALGKLLTEDYLQKTGELIDQGYQTIKYKIGVDFSSELRRVRKLRKEFPQLTIRLDANQAWSVKQAISHLSALEALEIEYCEEPLRKNTPQHFEHLALQTNLPLAIDESIHQVDYWPNLLPFTSYLIIKPMMIGRFERIIETKRLAETNNNRVVFTTSLESSIGRRVTAELASGLGTTEIAHGLDTGKLLADDLHSDKKYISNGCFYIDEMKSNTIIDPDQLNRIATVLN